MENKGVHRVLQGGVSAFSNTGERFFMFVLPACRVS
jgi:hypothetical protein